MDGKKYSHNQIIDFRADAALVLFKKKTPYTGGFCMFVDQCALHFCSCLARNRIPNLKVIRGILQLLNHKLNA